MCWFGGRVVSVLVWREGCECVGLEGGLCVCVGLEGGLCVCWFGGRVVSVLVWREGCVMVSVVTDV